MKAFALAAVVAGACVLVLAAQQKGQRTDTSPALEKQIWNVEQQWLQGELLLNSSLVERHW